MHGVSCAVLLVERSEDNFGILVFFLSAGHFHADINLGFRHQNAPRPDAFFLSRTMAVFFNSPMGCLALDLTVFRMAC